MLKNLTAALIVAGVMTTAAFAQNVDVKSAINDLSNRSGSVRQNAVMILGWTFWATGLSKINKKFFPQSAISLKMFSISFGPWIYLRGDPIILDIFSP